MGGMEAELEAHPELDAVVPAGVDHSCSVGDGGGHGLLGEYVLSGVGGADGLAGVQVVGGGDKHGVDTGVGEEGIEVAVGGCGTVLFGEGVGTGLVSAVDGDEAGVVGQIHSGGRFLGRRGSRCRLFPTLMASSCSLTREEAIENEIR